MLAKYLGVGGANGGAGHGVFLLSRNLGSMTSRTRCRTHVTIPCGVLFGGPPAGRLNPRYGEHRHAGGRGSLSEGRRSYNAHYEREHELERDARPCG